MSDGNQKLHHTQAGAATIFTALVLLFLIVIVAVAAGRNASVSHRMNADHYRIKESTAAASAAMDHALAYYKAQGFDQTGASGSADGDLDYQRDGSLSYTANGTGCSAVSVDDLAFSLSSGDGSRTVFARYYFDNAIGNSCSTEAGKMNRGMVSAYGWSDDCSAMKQIHVCVTNIDIFPGGEGPKQPFITKGSVGVFGNASIINRYNNSTIWAGGADDVNGAAFATYLRPADKEVAALTDEELKSTDENSNAVKVSDRNSGIGFDVITNDATLASKTSSSENLIDRDANQFFDLFFEPTKAQMRDLAEDLGTLNDSGTNLDQDLFGRPGLIWHEGDLGLSGSEAIGSAGEPAVLIVNGALDLSGMTIYGVVYVVGKLKVTGNPNVFGTIISESGENTGAGTPRIVYVPWGDHGEGGGGLFFGGAVVPGSWRDWSWP